MLFAGVVLAVAGVSLLTLGISFNYFVALFQQQPVQRGFFSKAIGKYNFDQHLGWVGLAMFLLAIVLAVASLVLGSQGWPVSRLWFYYLISISLALVGVQLVVAYVQMQVLDALRARNDLVMADLQGSPINEESTLPEQRHRAISEEAVV